MSEIQVRGWWCGISTTFAQNNYNKMTRKVWAYKAEPSQGNQLIINFMMLFTYIGQKGFI